MVEDNCVHQNQFVGKVKMFHFCESRLAESRIAHQSDAIKAFITS